MRKITKWNFLSRFDTLSLDCNDHLFVYDGGHAAGNPKVSKTFLQTHERYKLIFNFNLALWSFYQNSMRLFVCFSTEFVRFHRKNFLWILNFSIIFYRQADISCRNTKQSMGVLFTNTNHITLKYVTDNWGTDSNGFKLVVSVHINLSMVIESRFNHWFYGCVVI